MTEGTSSTKWTAWAEWATSALHPPEETWTTERASMAEGTVMTKGTMMWAVPLALMLQPGRCPTLIWTTLELIGKTPAETVKHCSILPFSVISMLAIQYDISLLLV
jgi:hypothetical protein